MKTNELNIAQNVDLTANRYTGMKLCLVPAALNSALFTGIFSLLLKCNIIY